MRAVAPSLDSTHAGNNQPTHWYADCCCSKALKPETSTDLLLSHVCSSTSTESDEDRSPALLGQALHQMPVDVGGFASSCTMQTSDLLLQAGQHAMTLRVPSNVKGRDFIVLLLLCQPHLYELANTAIGLAIGVMLVQLLSFPTAVRVCYEALCMKCTRPHVDKDPQACMEAD